MPPRTLALLLVTVLPCALEGAARAADPVAPPNAAPHDQTGGITPPKAIETTTTYPPNADGNGTVVLELTIDADGSVLEANAVQGEEPFASHARSAALRFRFEPALRDGKPVKARVRFEVRFVKETTQEPSTGEPANAPVTRAPEKKPGQRPYEVVVRGARAAPGGVSVSRAEARQLPGAFGSPFRAVESLPGLTPVVSGVPYFYVRGAPPGNVGYFVDGVRVPLLFHALLGPAVIHPSILDSVTLYRGGYPARYGRYAGGILSAELAPPPESVHGEASLTWLDSGAYVTAPLGEHASATAAGHYSYTRLTLTPFTGAIVDYWDYQTIANYDLTRNDRISVFAFGSYDFLSAQTAATDQNGKDFGAEFHRVDLRYDHSFDARTSLRAAVTLGYDHSRATDGEVSDSSLAGRTEFLRRGSDRSVLRIGGDVSADRYTLALAETQGTFHDFKQLFPSRTDLVGGVYVDEELHPESWITLEAGVRTDVFHSEGRTAVGVDPRLGATFAVSKRVRLVHALGLAHQSPNYIPSLPGAQVGGLRGGLQKSVQSSAGVEVDGPEDVTGSLTVFEQAFFNLSDPLGYSRSVATNVDVAEVRANGYAYGAELMIQRPLTRRLGGMISYTLSRSVRSHDRVNSLSAFDHTHVASATLSYDFGRLWRAGARGVFSSGVPTEMVGIDGPRYVGQRGPPYYRLDVRLEKRWRVGRAGWLGFLAEVQNATLSHEVTGRTCNTVRCTEVGVGPLLLPNVGVEGGF
jgi:TonB family protein